MWTKRANCSRARVRPGVARRVCRGSWRVYETLTLAWLRFWGLPAFKRCSCARAKLAQEISPPSPKWPARRVDETRLVSAGARAGHRRRGGRDTVWNLPRAHHHVHRRTVDRTGAAKCLANDRRNGAQGDKDMKDRVPIRKLPSGVSGLDEVLGGGIPEFSFN